MLPRTGYSTSPRWAPRRGGSAQFLQMNFLDQCEPGIERFPPVRGARSPPGVARLVAARRPAALRCPAEVPRPRRGCRRAVRSCARRSVGVSTPPASVPSGGPFLPRVWAGCPAASRPRFPGEELRSCLVDCRRMGVLSSRKSQNRGPV